jgi:cell shape-determining protein MreC
MDITVIIAMVAIFLTIVGLIVQHFGVISKIAQRVSSLETICESIEDTTEIRERCASLETKVDLFWKLVEENVSELLKSPHNLHKDDLLDKLKAKELNLDEARELEQILDSEVRDKALDGGSKLAYILVRGHLGRLITTLEKEG